MARFHPISQLNETASERLPSKTFAFVFVLSTKAGCVFPLDYQIPEANIHMWLYSEVTSRLSAKKPRV